MRIQLDIRCIQLGEVGQREVYKSSQVSNYKNFVKVFETQTRITNTQSVLNDIADLTTSQ